MTSHGYLPDTARLVRTDALRGIRPVEIALGVEDVACELGTGNRVVRAAGAR